jgi:hypothetical protein
MRRAVLVALILGVATGALAQDDPFDTPLDKKVVDLGPSPANLPGMVRVRIELSCFFYRDFMVKQLDQGEKGAEWLAIVPGKTGSRRDCSQSHSTGEKVVDPREGWGYFAGAKGDLAFFVAADGTNGGMPFAVYNSRSGARVFVDTYYDASLWNNQGGNSPFDRLRIDNTSSGQTTLIYLRVVPTPCDLHKEPASCWTRVRKKLGIRSDTLPACIAYEDISDRWTSAVAFPVQVSLYPQPHRKTIDGPVKCWPVD